MHHYQHILLAVDFSEHTETIALKAQKLANDNQATLSLLHIVDSASLISLNYDVELPYTSLNELLIDTGKKKLKKLNQDLQLSCQQRWVEIGRSSDEIVRVAKENSIDLIVMGSHGRHGLRLLLGSTANAVLHHARCDVLAVRINHD